MRGRITKRLVDAMKPAARDTFVWDELTPGFGLKVTPKGRRIYVLQWERAGVPRRYTIGRHGLPGPSGLPWTPDTAREEAVRLLGVVAAGGDPAEAKQEAKAEPTLKEFAARYLAEHAKVKKKPRSANEDERLLEKRLLPALGRRKLASISRADVQRLHLEMREAPYAANRALALLSKMMNLGEAWGLRPDGSNPCRHVQRFKEARRERFLSEEELSRLGKVLAAAER